MKTKQLHNQLDTIERIHAHLIKRVNVAQQGFTLQVYSKAVPDPDGKHRWRVVASNGQTVCSGEGYHRKRDRERMLSRLFPYLEAVEVEA